MRKNIPQIIESDSQIQDKCSWWFNTNEGVIYRYDDAKESWVPIDMSDSDKEGIINSAVTQATYVSNIYSDEQNNKLEKELLEKINILEKKQYPTCRYARHGRIDTSNCKGVDYILVPCNKKCQLLYVTNNYLKTFCEKTTRYDLIEKYNLPVYLVRENIYDYHLLKRKTGGYDWGTSLTSPIVRELTQEEKKDVNYFIQVQNECADYEEKGYSIQWTRQTFGVTRSDIMKAFSKWYSDDECILKSFDRKKMPANDILNYNLYIYTKSITTRHRRMSRVCDMGNFKTINEKHVGVYKCDEYKHGDPYTMSCFTAQLDEYAYPRWILHEVKTWHGIRQFVYGGFKYEENLPWAQYNLTPDNVWVEYFPKDMRYIRVDAQTYEKYKKDKTKICVSPSVISRFPYMIFKNPFRGNVGGIIPVIDGVLRLEYAKECINRTLMLVSNNNQILEFDDRGICKQPLNPNFTEIFSPYHNKVHFSRNYQTKPYPRRKIDFFKLRRKCHYFVNGQTSGGGTIYSTPVYYNYLSRKHIKKTTKNDGPNGMAITKFRSTNPPTHMPSARKKFARKSMHMDAYSSIWINYDWENCNFTRPIFELGNKAGMFQSYISAFAYGYGQELNNEFYNYLIGKKMTTALLLQNTVDDYFIKKIKKNRPFYNIKYNKLLDILNAQNAIKYNILFSNGDTFSGYKSNPYYKVNKITLGMIVCQLYNSNHGITKNVYLKVSPWSGHD